MSCHESRTQVVILNVFVVVMAICFEPSRGSIEAFSLDEAQRKRTAAILKVRRLKRPLPPRSSLPDAFLPSSRIALAH